jgi:hypothetical protein
MNYEDSQNPTSYMKINVMNKLDGSLLLEMPVKTTGDQICKNTLQEWIRIVEPSNLYTANGSDSPQKRLNSEGRTIFFLVRNKQSDLVQEDSSNDYTVLLQERPQFERSK